MTSPVGGEGFENGPALSLPEEVRRDSIRSLGGLPLVPKVAKRSKTRPSEGDRSTHTTAALEEALHHLNGGRVDLAKATLEHLVAQLH